MTTEPMRPARIAGLALLGVAAVATVLGVVTLLGGDGDNQAGQPTPPASTSPAGPSGGTTTGQTSISGPPTTTAPTVPATTTTKAAPTSATGRPGTTAPSAPGGGDQGSFKEQPVRVYNNSNIKGLADRAGEDLAAAGWDVVEVGNHQGLVPVTTVYFRPGTPEEAAARELGRTFKIRVEPRFDGIADSSPGLIVIITKEYAERIPGKQ
ncbi:LytR C-terminal domain-containing protein [Actinokineospora sp. 24-640]